MTTPRDFVKQDSPLGLLHRCENFLDQLAAKGRDGHCIFV